MILYILGDKTLKVDNALSNCVKIKTCYRSFISTFFFHRSYLYQLFCTLLFNCLLLHCRFIFTGYVFLYSFFFSELFPEHPFDSFSIIFLSDVSEVVFTVTILICYLHICILFIMSLFFSKI